MRDMPGMFRPDAGAPGWADRVGSFVANISGSSLILITTPRRDVE